MNCPVCRRSLDEHGYCWYCKRHYKIEVIIDPVQDPLQVTIPVTISEVQKIIIEGAVRKRGISFDLFFQIAIVNLFEKWDLFLK